MNKKMSPTIFGMITYNFLRVVIILIVTSFLFPWNSDARKNQSEIHAFKADDVFDFSKYIPAIALVFGALGIIVIIKMMIKRYNAFQPLTQAVSEANSNILVSMKKRAVLSDKLISIASVYGDHEKLTQMNISHATNRSAATNFSLNRFMALAQNFPDLRANETYQTLMRQLEEIEADLQTKRETYNAVVKQYNTFRNRFPTVLIAVIFGYKTASYFDVNDSEMLDNIKDIQSDDNILLKSTLLSSGYQIPEQPRNILSETQTAVIQHEYINRQLVVCKNCNTSVEEDTKFCGECGHAVA